METKANGHTAPSREDIEAIAALANEPGGSVVKAIRASGISYYNYYKWKRIYEGKRAVVPRGPRRAPPNAAQVMEIESLRLAGYDVHKACKRIGVSPTSYWRVTRGRHRKGSVRNKGLGPAPKAASPALDEAPLRTEIWEALTKLCLAMPAAQQLVLAARIIDHIVVR